MTSKVSFFKMVNSCKVTNLIINGQRLTLDFHNFKVYMVDAG